MLTVEEKAEHLLTRSQYDIDCVRTCSDGLVLEKLFMMLDIQSETRVLKYVLGNKYTPQSVLNSVLDKHKKYRFSVLDYLATNPELSSKQVVQLVKIVQKFPYYSKIYINKKMPVKFLETFIRNDEINLNSRTSMLKNPNVSEEFAKECLTFRPYQIVEYALKNKNLSFNNYLDFISEENEKTLSDRFNPKLAAYLIRMGRRQLINNRFPQFNKWFEETYNIENVPIDWKLKFLNWDRY